MKTFSFSTIIIILNLFWRTKNVVLSYRIWQVIDLWIIELIKKYQKKLTNLSSIIWFFKKSFFCFCANPSFKIRLLNNYKILRIGKRISHMSFWIWKLSVFGMLDSASLFYPQKCGKFLIIQNGLRTPQCFYCSKHKMSYFLSSSKHN